MNRRVISVIFFVINLLAVTNGQLGTVGTPCYSSGTCFGYTTCMQNRCACTSGYQQVGTTCIQATLGGQGGYGQMGMGQMGMGQMGMGYGGMGQMGGCQPGMTGCGQGGVIMPSMVYPGQACGSSYGTCGGGSFCQSGVCCCPTSYSQTITGCVPNVVGMGGMGGMGYGMGGMGGMGYGMGSGYGMGMGMMPMYGMGMGGMGMGGMGMGGMGMGGMGISGIGVSIPIGCTGGCGGGAFCQSGACMCPSNYLYQNSMCMPMMGMGMGMGYPMMNQMYGGYGMGGMGMGMGGGGQILLSINVGGYCQTQSMMSSCVMGATCIQSSCRCMGDFFAQGSMCIRRRLRKDPKDRSNEKTDVNSTKSGAKLETAQQPPLQNLTNTFSSNSIVNRFSKKM